METIEVLLARRQVGSVVIAGSKSFTNRALILSAYARGKSKICGASYSEDSKLLIQALRRFAIKIDDSDQENILVDSTNIEPFSGEIDLGAAGTSMRFLLSFVSAIPGTEVKLVGSERMHERPIKDLVDGLLQLGAEITYLGREGCPPLLVKGKELNKNSVVKLRANVSSQYLSSIIMLLPYIGGGEIKLEGEAVSKSYIDMTLASMHAFSAEIENHNYKKLTVLAKEYAPTNYEVEADYSGASYFSAISALSATPHKIYNLSKKSIQGDAKFFDILKQMGCHVSSYAGNTMQASYIEVSRSAELKAVNVDMELLPDTAQTLAVLAVKARGTTRITGLQTLRVKETDRILALQTELKKINITTRAGDNYIEIDGQGEDFIFPKALIATYKDHRMAMSFACLVAGGGVLQIEEPEVVAKSMPDFWAKIKSIGFQVE